MSEITERYLGWSQSSRIGPQVSRLIRSTHAGLCVLLVSVAALLPKIAIAQDGGAPAGSTGGPPPWMGNVFLIGTFVLIFYFLLLRPQQKRQKKMQAMIKSLKRGDRVLTTGGMFGTVLGLKDDVVVLTISDGVKVEFAKSAVTNVVEAAK